MHDVILIPLWRYYGLLIMAVRLLKKVRLPTKISSTVEKTNEITKTTLDHVKRILTDHDYLKHSNLDGENNEKTSIVMAEIKEPHVDQKNVLSDMQEQSEACTSDDSKVFLTFIKGKRVVFTRVL
jgi:hypothetical protein